MKAPAKSKRMTAAQYKRAREQLGLSNYAAGPLLGLSQRQARRVEAAEAPVPRPVEKLLDMLQRHGIPDDWPR